MDTPGLEFAFEARVQVGTPVEVGPVPGGRRRVVPILGGTVAGPRLMGEVLPGGADWQIVSADGLTDLTARYLLRAGDGAIITVVNRGLRHAAPAVMARLLAGEAVDPALVYFRCVPVLEAPDGAHGWMNGTIFVGTGARHPAEVVIRVFAVT